MTDKSPNQLVEDIIDLMDSHGFTTEHPDNVEALKDALSDLIYNHSTQEYSEWCETYHCGIDTNNVPPF